MGGVYMQGLYLLESQPGKASVGGAPCSRHPCDPGGTRLSGTRAAAAVTTSLTTNSLALSMQFLATRYARSSQVRFGHKHANSALVHQFCLVWEIAFAPDKYTSASHRLDLGLVQTLFQSKQLVILLCNACVSAAVATHIDLVCISHRNWKARQENSFLLIHNMCTLPLLKSHIQILGSPTAPHTPWMLLICAVLCSASRPSFPCSRTACSGPLFSSACLLNGGEADWQMQTLKPRSARTSAERLLGCHQSRIWTSWMVKRRSALSALNIPIEMSNLPETTK